MSKLIKNRPCKGCNKPLPPFYPSQNRKYCKQSCCFNDTDYTDRVYSDERNSKISKSSLNVPKSAEHCKNISKARVKGLSDGSLKVIRPKKGISNGIRFDSGLEEKFILRCIELGIEVERYDGEIHTYTKLNGKESKYSPDFYLPKYDVTIEVKGYYLHKLDDNHRVKYEIFSKSNPEILWVWDSGNALTVYNFTIADIEKHVQQQNIQ